jgi:DGQHR domain-containing protein
MDKIYAIKISQKERPILIFTLQASDLIAIAYYNRREIDRKDGIQREFNQQRSKEIADYLEEDDAVLANNIIINLELEKNGFSFEDIYDEEKKEFDVGLLIKKSKKDHKKTAFVIDGQHRLRAFEFTNQNSFPLVISAMIDLSLAEVAEIFVKINYYQKPVNKSLVLDLLGISKKMFPEYFILHNVVEKLNDDMASPFYGNVKMLGTGKGYVSQASLISAMEKYKIREILKNAGITPTEDVLYNLIWNYFEAVKKTFPEFWGEKKILCKNIGIRAMFNIMKLLLQKTISKKQEFSPSIVSVYLKKIDRNIFSSPDSTAFGGEKGVKYLSDKILSCFQGGEK